MSRRQRGHQQHPGLRRPQPRHHHRAGVHQFAARPVAGADLPAGHPRRHRDRHAVAAVPPHPVDHRAPGRCPSPAPPARFPAPLPPRRRPSPPRRRRDTPRRCPPAARPPPTARPRNGRSFDRCATNRPSATVPTAVTREAAQVTRRDLLQAQRLPHRAREGHQHAEARGHPRCAPAPARRADSQARRRPVHLHCAVRR